MRFSDEEIRSEIETYTEKPMVYEVDMGYPYYLLTDRQFEILLYLLFKSGIENGDYEESFDAVSLMTGVGERGRDCELYYQGNKVGLVQCKHSIEKNKRLDKSTVACEIIKFGLHCLSDPSLVSDIKNYTYYFVVSADFSEPAISLLSDFGRQVTKEPKFRKWVEKTIEEYASFSVFTYDTVKGKLAEVFRAITVEKMTSVDLNAALSRFSDLASHFFSVKVVFSEEALEKGVRQLQNTFSDGILEMQQQQSYNFAQLELLIRQHLVESKTEQADIESKSPQQTWLEQAEIHYQEGDLKKAFVAINQAWKLDNQSLQIINVRGCILAEYAIATQGPKSMFYEAIGLFESLRDQALEPAGVEYNIGNCYAGLDEHEKAIKYFEIALAMNPRPEIAAQTWKNRGTSYAHLGDQGEEIASYRKSLELDPNLFEAYASWGAAMLRCHKYQEAKELFLKAFDVAPERKMHAYSQLYSFAYTLWKLEDFEGAYSYVNQVLAIQPTHQDGLLLKAYLLRDLWPKNLKYVFEAITFYENWVLDNPEDTAARGELYLIYHSDKYQHSSRVILEQTALSSNPPVQALYNYALLLDDEGRTKKAIKYLEMAFQKSREHYIVHKLGILKEKSGDYLDAIRFYELALEDVSDPIPILHGIADCYHFLEQYRACVRVLTRAILIDPQSSISWTNLGYALDQLQENQISFICLFVLQNMKDDDSIAEEVIEAAIAELLSRLRSRFGEDFVTQIQEKSQFT